MEIRLTLVVYGLIVLLILIFALLLFIVQRRVIRLVQSRKMDVLSERLETDILLALSAEDDGKALQVAAEYKDHPAVLMRALTEYMVTISGVQQERLKLIYEKALKKSLLRDIKSRFTHIRLRAIRPFVLFADGGDFPLIRKLIHDKPPIRLAVIDGLSSIPRPEVITQLFQAFLECSESDLRAYMNVMHGIGRRIDRHVQDYLNMPLSIPKLGMLIEMVGAIPLPRLYDSLLKHANHPDKEIRIRVARSLGSLNILPRGVKKTLSTLAGDAAWEVQAQAFKSLGRLRITPALKILQDGLSSPHWHCRRNAAQALAVMGEAGIDRLRKTAAKSDDLFAMDMARMVLEETAISQAPG
jgi:hypothetical protein